MAHSAIDKKLNKYNRLSFMIRAKLYKGLIDGTMNMRTIFDDEKIKLNIGKICNYCGSEEDLSLDHVLPRKYGGEDIADNLTIACKRCNSSKGSKDLMKWTSTSNTFPPLMIIRRYLKLVFYYCEKRNLLDNDINELDNASLPFKIELLPLKYPQPKELRLTVND